MTALLAGGFILNQIRDADADRLNEKCFLIPRGIVSLRAAWIELAVLWAAAVALAVAGWIHPLVAAVLMPLSSLTVISHSYRARTF